MRAGDMIDTRTEAIELAAEACIDSEDLTTRALDWVAEHADDELAKLIVDHYVESPQFATWVVDVADGVDVA